MLRETQKRVTDITKELANIKEVLRTSQTCLKHANTYQELQDQFVQTFSIPSHPSPEPVLLTLQHGGPAEIAHPHGRQGRTATSVLLLLSAWAQNLVVYTGKVG